MQQLTQNWRDVFIGFLILGILLFLLFRLVHYFVPILLKNKKGHDKLRRFLPGIEMVSWLIFFSWYSLKFYAQYNIYTLIVLGIIVIIAFWISRFLIKELIAGVVFKIAARYDEGDRIQSGQHSGTIKKLHFNSVEIEASDGQIVFIPYSKLSGEITIKNDSVGQTSAHTFQLETLRKDEPGIISGNINNFILSLPWSSVTTNPQVTLLDQEGEKYKFDITCYPVDKSYAKKMEQKVLDKFGEQNPVSAKP